MPVAQNDNKIASRLKKPVHPYIAYGVIAGVALVIAAIFLTIAVIKTPKVMTSTSSSAEITPIVTATPTMTPTELENDSTQVDTQLTQSDDDLNNIDKSLNDQMDPSLQQ